jgi:hypothetical protein
MSDDQTEKPPKHVREASRRALGDLLRELQERFDSGEMVCLAGVWMDDHGAPTEVVAGLEVGNELPNYLNELADSVADYAEPPINGDKERAH